jgi:hypothetical protein
MWSSHSPGQRFSGLVSINRHLKQLLLLALLIGASVSLLHAQAGSGTIVGTVSDASGAVIPLASVRVVDQNTGTAREVTANAQGYYVIPSLPPAVYDVTVNSRGFAPFRRTNVTLLADQHLTVDIQMQVAGSSQTVSVSDIPTTQVDATTSTLSQVIEQKRIVDLPLDGRNPVQLAVLVPGAMQAPANNADQGQYKTLPVAITISANGSRANQTAFNLDGSSNNDIYTNVNQPFPFPDALQEFSVQTSNYTARYGGNSGAIVNAITRSGTNQFHGDLFEFNRNAILNARNHFASVRDQLKRNQFGGVIGGPIIRDKTFFFFGYQQTQIRDEQNGKIAYVPTPAELNGDFSAIHTQLFDPATKAPYPGNQIPVSQFDPAAVKFVSSYLPRSSSPNGQVVYALPLSQSFNEYVIRGDQTLTPSDHLFARYYLDRYDDNPFLTPSNYLSTVSRSQINSHNAILGETHTFTSNLLNDFRLSFSRVSTNAGPPGNSISVADLGVAVSQPARFARALDGINVSGYFNISSFPPSIMNRNNYMVADDVSWIHGRHTFAFGGVLARGQVIIRDAYLAGGSFSFTADNSGDALSSFLLGSIRTFQQGNGEFKDDRDYVAALYAQDDYHVTRRLTLNLGLRWAPYAPWYENNGRVEQFRASNYDAGIVSTRFPNAPVGLLFPGDPGMPKHGVTNTWTDFSPRVGFAFDPTGNGMTSIRGGAGVFYDSQQVGIENNRFVDVSPFSTQVAVTTPAGSFSNPYLGMADPFPAPAVPSPDSIFPSPVLVVSYDPAHNSRMLPPVTYNYNLTVEHQFPQAVLLRAAYVGSQSRHQAETIELNPAVYMPGSKLSTDARRRFTGYGSIGQGTDDLIANYNSFQISAQRRLNSVTLLANYTYSKALDDVPAGQGNAGIASQSDSALPVTNPLRHQFDYGRADFDRRHVITASYVWDLPRLQSRNFAERILAGGWQTTGIVNYESGQALTPLAGSDRSQTGLGRDRAIQISPRVYGGNACGSAQPCVSYLNPAAFVTNYTAASYPLGSAGNVGKGAFNGPGFVTWAAGAMKNFSLTEATRLQFHAEFFNVLNHTNLGNPNLTANAPSFGAVQGMNGDPRIGQLALKLIF